MRHVRSMAATSLPGGYKQLYSPASLRRGGSETIPSRPDMSIFPVCGRKPARMSGNSALQAASSRRKSPQRWRPQNSPIQAFPGTRFARARSNRKPCKNKNLSPFAQAENMVYSFRSSIERGGRNDHHDYWVKFLPILGLGQFLHYPGFSGAHQRASVVTSGQGNYYPANPGRHRYCRSRRQLCDVAAGWFDV